MASERDRNDDDTTAAAADEELTKRLRALRDLLCSGLVERDVAIRLALLATLAGEHLLLIGPPGTAKSLLARRLRLAFKDATYFERLLTRFTVPEELFGPLSIKALEEDRYERLTERYLPTASVAFLDEIFKANSAILNALLTLLNEREFDNGIQREKTPLLAAVGASNELPEGEELAALFDRFLLRLYVGPVSGEGFGELLALRGNAPPEIPERLKLSAAELEEVRVNADAITVPEDVVALLMELRLFCAKEALPVSDRRWRKVVKLLQVSALTNGRDEVSIWDCWLLQHCLWDEPEQRGPVYDWYAERVGASAAMDPERLTKIVVAWEAQLGQDQESRSQQVDEEGRLLFRGADGEPVASETGPVHATNENGELLYVAQPDWLNAYRRGLGGVAFDNNGAGYTAAELGQLWVVDEDGDQQRVRDWSERANYMEKTASWLTEEAELPPIFGPTRHKVIYVDSCIAQVNAIADDVTAYQADLDAHVAGLESQVHKHLWLTASFAEPAAASLRGTRATVSELAARVQNLRKGFELLPRERQVSPVSDV